MLARDIYRDLYEEPGPTLEEKLFLVSKRLGITVGACALALAVLDFAGIHSVPGTNKLVQLSRAKIASLSSASAPVTQSAAAPSPSKQEVRLAIPKSMTPPTPPRSTTVDGLAAMANKDAITLAMTPSIAPSPVFMPPAAPLEMPVPSASLSAPVVSSVAPPLSEIAAKSHASVPPVQEFKLASVASADIATSLPVVTTTVTNAPITIPLSKVPLPRAAPPMSPADRLGLKDKEYARAQRCLANAIYFEARSEPIRGQMAVAQVVLNRAFSGFYPNDICGVVYQNASRHLACQFTFACDGKRKLITERGHWAVANRIAKQTLDGQIYVPEVAKSTHYHASYVHPNWVREMKKLVRFGVHSFYRPYAWGNGNEEPVWGNGAALARVQKTAAR